MCNQLYSKLSLSLCFSRDESLSTLHTLTGGDRDTETATRRSDHRRQNGGEAEDGQNHGGAGPEVDRRSEVRHEAHALKMLKMELRFARRIKVNKL